VLFGLPEIATMPGRVNSGPAFVARIALDEITRGVSGKRVKAPSVKGAPSKSVLMKCFIHLKEYKFKLRSSKKCTFAAQENQQPVQNNDGSGENGLSVSTLH